jgi:hypothetical protein
MKKKKRVWKKVVCRKKRKEDDDDDGCCVLVMARSFWICLSVVTNEERTDVMTTPRGGGDPTKATTRASRSRRSVQSPCRAESVHKYFAKGTSSLSEALMYFPKLYVVHK